MDGHCLVDLEVRCLRRPVHSGQKGGAVPDAVQILCRLIAGLPSAVAVVALEAQPILGSANQILAAVRVRLSLSTAPGMDARQAGRRLLKQLTARPAHGARVRGRVR